MKNKEPKSFTITEKEKEVLDKFMANHPVTKAIEEAFKEGLNFKDTLKKAFNATNSGLTNKIP